MSELTPPGPESLPIPPKPEGRFEPGAKGDQYYFLLKVSPILILKLHAKPYEALSPEQSEKWLSMSVRNLSIRGEVNEEKILIDVDSFAHQLNIDPTLLKKELSEAKRVGDIAIQTLIASKIKAYDERVAKQVDDYIQKNKESWFTSLKKTQSPFVPRKLVLGLPQSFSALITNTGQIFLKAKPSFLIAKGGSSRVIVGKSQLGSPIVFGMKKFETSDTARLQTQVMILNKLKGKEGVYDFHYVYVYPRKETTTLGIVSAYYEFKSLGLQLESFLATDKDFNEGLGNLTGSRLEYPIYHVLKQVLKGIMNIHASGVLHRDIKDDNIFLERAGNELKAVVGDFDLACFLSDSVELKQVKGTLPLFPPELCKALRGDDVSGLKFGTPIDMWGFGMLCFKLISGGYLPSWTDPLIELQDALVKNENVDPKPYLDSALKLMESGIPVLLADEHAFYRLIGRALAMNPADRITFPEMLKEM